MSTLDRTIIEYIKALQPYALPIALIIVTLLVIIIFRQEIKAMLNRIRAAKIPRLGLDLDLDGSTSRSTPTQLSGLPTEAQQSDHMVPQTVKDKPANLFWLGSDLRWVQLMLALRESREPIVNSLRQSYWHTRELGIGAPVSERLRRMTEFADNSLEGDWTENRRQEYFDEINSIISIIDGPLRQMTLGFRARESDPIIETNGARQ